MEHHHFYRENSLCISMVMFNSYVKLEGMPCHAHVWQTLLPSSRIDYTGMLLPRGFPLPNFGLEGNMCEALNGTLPWCASKKMHITAPDSVFLAMFPVNIGWFD